MVVNKENMLKVSGIIAGNKVENLHVDGRIAYVDCIRGFAMLLVIWDHVADLTFGLRLPESLWMQLFIPLQLPLFFFISGYVAFKSCEYFQYRTVILLTLKKCRLLLIPVAIFWFIGVLLICGKEILDIPEVFAKLFPGYWWFTEALFIMFIIYYGTFTLANYINKNLAFPLLFVESVVLLLLINTFRQNSITSYLTMPEVGHYFVYFVFGLYIGMRKGVFFRAIHNNTFITVCILTVCAITYIVYLDNFNFSNRSNALLWLANGFPFICVIFRLFENSAMYWASDKQISIVFRFIGRRTLDLYVLHFFFLPDHST